MEKPEFKPGIQIIRDERIMQVCYKNYTQDHDVLHDGQELLLVAMELLLHVLDFPEETEFCEEHGHDQPWMKYIWDHERPNNIKRLAVAGALIAAEIDRLQRCEGGQSDT